jgi:hypothetical protein
MLAGCHSFERNFQPAVEKLVVKYWRTRLQDGASLAVSLAGCLKKMRRVERYWIETAMQDLFSHSSYCEHRLRPDGCSGSFSERWPPAR